MQADMAKLDKVFAQMFETLDQSKQEIFIISEQSRRSYGEMEAELLEIRARLSVLIDKADALERAAGRARNRLAAVSKNFQHYAEDDVRAAYSAASELQLDLHAAKLEERTLRNRRDELERRLKGLLDTLERADHLIAQVNVVLGYLSLDLKDVSDALETAQLKQDFGLKIIEAQEEERRRLSREIHDGPAQLIANVLLRLDIAEKIGRDRSAQEAMAEIAALKPLVRQTLMDVRRIIYDLRPMALDDLGLVPTLRKYMATMGEYNPGVAFHFDSTGPHRRLPPNVEVAIFRIVQEAITNAIKHGGGTDIDVRMDWRNETVRFRVQDNGKGFNVGEVKDKSFGLLGMGERLSILGGSMDIDSEPGAGTKLSFRIPLRTEAQSGQTLQEEFQ